ncbi:MAG: hypothetical protein H6R14_2544 [Proteobacteria bacterium]|nr:hypothetical protein [Pseudomonadota bacterium]
MDSRLRGNDKRQRLICDALGAPVEGAEQPRGAGSFRLALSEPKASSGKPPGPPSSARYRAKPGAAPGVAFSLATFFWRSKRKYARRSAAKPSVSENTARASGAETSASAKTHAKSAEAKPVVGQSQQQPPPHPRRRTTSNKQTAAAAATFSDSTAPGMGIRIRNEAASINSFRTPCPSAPNTQATGPSSRAA